MTLSYALVTGGNRGIGFGIATGLFREGFFTLIGCRKITDGEEALARLKDKYPLGKGAVVQVDITSDDSIIALKKHLEETYGYLDIHVNNAGVGRIPQQNDQRETYAEVFNANVTSVVIITDVLIPLLLKSPNKKKGKIINVSSHRGSLFHNSQPSMPPTVSLPYSASKTALNLITVEFSKRHPELRFYLACPGFCKTAFNNFRGTKDPEDGGKVVVALSMSDDDEFGSGSYWELEESKGQTKPTRVEW